MNRQELSNNMNLISELPTATDMWIALLTLCEELIPSGYARFYILTYILTSADDASLDAYGVKYANLNAPQQTTRMFLLRQKIRCLVDKL